MAKKSSNNKTKKMKQVSEKKKREKNAKKTTLPRSSDMVLEALANLEEKKGSSLQAIKKYITSTYGVDMAKQSSHINKYLKSAVEKNEIVQTKGNGASGRFRLPTMADLRREKQKNMPKKPPSKKQAPMKPSAATKKSDARKNTGGKPKSSVDKRGRKPNGLKVQRPVASKNSKK